MADKLPDELSSPYEPWEPTLRWFLITFSLALLAVIGLALLSGLLSGWSTPYEYARCIFLIGLLLVILGIFPFARFGNRSGGRSLEAQEQRRLTWMVLITLLAGIISLTAGLKLMDLWRPPDGPEFWFV